MLAQTEKMLAWIGRENRVNDFSAEILIPFAAQGQTADWSQLSRQIRQDSGVLVLSGLLTLTVRSELKLLTN